VKILSPLLIWLPSADPGKSLSIKGNFHTPDSVSQVVFS
jgi:hypothetical protein